MPYDITYMWNLKYNMGVLIHKTETNRDNGLVAQVGGVELGV